MQLNRRVNISSAFILIWMGLAMTIHTKTTVADTIDLIPAPVQMTQSDGQFVLLDTTVIFTSNNKVSEKVATYLAEKLNRPTGFSLKVIQANSHTTKQTIQLLLLKTKNKTLGDEGYQLSIKTNRVSITANKPAGLFYGVQTLLQLLPAEIESTKKIDNMTWTTPCVEIIDYPRFVWRGLLLDVSRHFFSKQEVKQYIDQMARYKFNIFHWHLTDDQGWRIEIKKYPKLTKIGAWRVPREGNWWTYDPPKPGEKPTYGGYYTQDEIREIVAYAKERFITIVPEIDVPGHSLAALAAHPELSCTGGPFNVNPGSKFYGRIQNTLCAGNEQTFTFLDDVFTEVAELFPGSYIHMGGDEAHKGFWSRCKKCQALKKEKGLKNEKELQSYFVKRVEKILQSKGKRLIGWDEILEGGLAPNATVMSWRGTKGGIKAAKMGHAVVMTPSPYYYLDLYQGDPIIEPSTYSMSRLNTSYHFEPIPSGIDAKLILGVQGNLWSEEVSELRHAQYMTWPRGWAIAETGWSPKSKKDWPDFVRRVKNQFKRMDVADVKYATSMFDVIIKPRRDKAGKLLIELTTEINSLTIHYTFDGANPDQHYPQYAKPLTVPLNAMEIRIVTCSNGHPIGKQINISIEELEKRVKK